MPSPVITDGATFSCKHGGSGSAASGLAISAVASNINLNGHHPLLAGASVDGFTAALGCTFQVLGVATPCLGFALPPPSGKAMSVGGKPVYCSADAAAIALIPSKGNGQPGLTVSEPQNVLSA